MTRRTHGFTFLELVVALALIFSMVALLLPALCRGTEAARRTSCQSNVKQHLGALSLYAQDHDGRYPGPGEDWTAATSDYTKNVQVLACPSEPPPSRLRFGVGRQLTTGGGGASYVYSPGHAADDAADTALLRDWLPWHQGRVNVGYLGGQVRWLTAPEAQADLPAVARLAPAPQTVTPNPQEASDEE